MVMIYAANQEEIIFEPESPSQGSQHQGSQSQRSQRQESPSQGLQHQGSQHQGSQGQGLQSQGFQPRVETDPMTSSESSSSSGQLIQTGFRQLDFSRNDNRQVFYHGNI